MEIKVISVTVFYCCFFSIAIESSENWYYSEKTVKQGIKNFAFTYYSREVKHMPGNTSEKFWIVVGDIHEHLDTLSKIPEMEAAAGIIVSGDLTNFGDVPQAEKVMSVLQTYKESLYAQIGNLDKKEVSLWLQEKGWNIHAMVRDLAAGVVLVGVGGSTPTPFGTPGEFPESTYTKWLDVAAQQVDNASQVLLVSHNPPKDTVCDCLPNGMHVGSEAVRAFIEKVQPAICICGHIHEAKGEDTIGATRIINPGMLSEGGYVVVSLSSEGKLDAVLRQV